MSIDMTFEILHVRVDTLSIGEVKERIGSFFSDSRFHSIVTLNPEILLYASRNDAYKSILNQSALSIIDGFGVKLALLLLFGKDISRFSGVSLVEYVLEQCHTRKERVMVILPEQSLCQVQDVERYFKLIYPLLSFLTLRLSVSEENDNSGGYGIIMQKLRNFAPVAVFVALGAPRQEIWSQNVLRTVPSVRLALNIGGSFDFLCGKIHRAPQWMRKCGLEWLWRLYQEPRYRVWRVFNAVIVFPGVVACSLFRKKY